MDRQCDGPTAIVDDEATTVGAEVRLLRSKDGVVNMAAGRLPTTKGPRRGRRERLMGKRTNNTAVEGGYGLKERIW